MNNGPIHAVLQHIRHLAAIEEFREQSDSRLLERFLATKEEAAFGALLQRHGPLVWRVCQRVLQHRQNAEDVFQATFLTLARKAATIRKQASVASWLHGVSYRLARRVQMELSRQRPLGDRSIADARPQGVDQSSARELQDVLDEELMGLKEQHRIPLVLCYLEGKSRDEAARQVGWSLRTLKRRLQAGRKLLASRLTRRGVSLGVAALSAGLLQSTVLAAPPPVLVGASSKAAALIVADKSVAGVISAQAIAISNNLVRSMFMTKLKKAAALILVLLALGGGAGVWAFLAPEPSQERQADAARKPIGDEVPGAEQPRERQDEKLVQARMEPADIVKRGEYLVNIMARCGNCHTPRTGAGELDMTKHLQGAPLWFTAKVRPRGEWAERAADITMSGRAGKWSEEKMIKFLSTGGKAEHPMPAYTMSVDDARAVTNYLRSLPGQKKDERKRDDD
jgi:RNA polymerase sigma factor (sigma-70 family)